MLLLPYKLDSAVNASEWCADPGDLGHLIHFFFVAYKQKAARSSLKGTQGNTLQPTFLLSSSNHDP